MAAAFLIFGDPGEGIPVSVPKKQFNMDNNKLVEVFSGTQWEATMIKNLLENEQIESFLKNEIMANLYTFNALLLAASP